jgi:hypothetical protein
MQAAMNFGFVRHCGGWASTAVPLALLIACASASKQGGAPSEQVAAPAVNAPSGPSQAQTLAAGPTHYHQPTWGDSSGKDGKGGTQLTVSGQGKLPLFAAGFDRAKRGDAVTAARPEWQLFHGSGGESLGFEWTWVTRGDEKYFGQLWGGGGVAFNDSWMGVDGTGAEYLVLWVKASRATANLTVRLHSALKAKGKEDTGDVSLEGFVPGGRIDEAWRRAVIPLSAFPDIASVELKGLQQVAFTVKPPPVENQKVTVFVDDVFLTNAEMVTPVTNLGYLVTAQGLKLEWDKAAGEKIEHFSIALNDRELGLAPPTARSYLIPREALGTSKAVVKVFALGRAEKSEPVSVEVNPALAPALPATVELGATTHDISPHVFGINGGSLSDLRHLGPAGNRWGGNRSTKYNWKDDIDSAGSDWFFLNDYGAEPGSAETQKSYHRFIKTTLDAKVPVNFTIPITPFIAKKHPTKGQRYCSYPTSLYPQQERTDGQGCGNGLTPDKQPIWGNDPNLGMTRNSPELQKAFVENLVKLFGRAARGGVEFYSLDNEPGLWMHTHRDTMPKGISSEQLLRLNLEYAAAVKAADPTAKVIGFAAWGVKELAGSNYDYFKAGVANGHELPEEGSFQEQSQRGGDSQLVFLLKELKKAEQKSGKRLIDAIDIHWYNELYAKNSLGRTQRVIDDVPYDAVFAPLQFESLREWWDPSFSPQAPLESWTYNADPQKDRLWRAYHPVIPALKKLLGTHYPGVKLAINEYDNGSPEHFHGALLRAVALGIFMREDLFMAQNWHQTGRDKFTYWAQKLYGNYDDHGSKVAGKYVMTTSSQPELYAFGAKRGATTTLVLVNRNKTAAIDVKLKLTNKPRKVRTFTLAESLGLRLMEEAPKGDASGLAVSVPAFSAVLVELG